MRRTGRPRTGKLGPARVRWGRNRRRRTYVSPRAAGLWPGDPDRAQLADCMGRSQRTTLARHEEPGQHELPAAGIWPDVKLNRGALVPTDELPENESRRGVSTFRMQLAATHARRATGPGQSAGSDSEQARPA